MNWHKKISTAFIALALGFSSIQAAERDFFSEANEAYDSGRYRDAITLYRAAIREGQREVFSWFNLGNTLVHLDKPFLAIVAYKRSAELAPEFVRPHSMLGDLYFLHDDMGAAIAAYRRAIEMGEDNEHLHFALGEAYFRTGENTLSLKHFEKVVRLNPDRLEAWQAQTEIYERLGDLEMAAEILEEAIRLSPVAGADIYLYLSYLYEQQEDWKKAIRSLEDALLLEGDNTSARLHLARLYTKQQSPFLSILTLEEGLDKEKNPWLALELAQVYFQRGRLDEALEWYLKAWSWGEFSGRQGAENVGHSYYNAGEKEKAEAVYEQIRSADY
jgi:tetratricopeptide (TPR) repeat protein